MNITEYVFRKRDGSIRTLRGTRDFEVFAKANPKTWDVIKPRGEKKACSQNITLIDVEINQWRSIKPDTIIARRIVKPFNPSFHLHDYEKKTLANILADSKKKSFIKRDRVPYYALMILNSAPLIRRNDLEVIVEGILEKTGREFTVRNGHVRAFTRAFHTFVKNGLITKLARKGDYYQITDKGRNLMTTGVRV